MIYPPLAENPLLTRDDLQRAVRDLFTPLLPHFSSGSARVRIGSTSAYFPASSAELEGFSRPLWGLIPLAMGGGEFGHWNLYQQGLINGTDPGHPEFWAPEGNQRFVEMAAISLGLAQAPQLLWDPLPPSAKKHLVAWLGEVNVATIPSNNWLFFRVFINLGLRSVGAPYDAERMEADFADLEKQYEGDGWYRDGIVSENHDYYISFGMHFYGLLYARFFGESDPQRAALYRERATVFASDFIQWFSADGSAIPFGRSQTYRFAQVSFWSAVALDGLEVFFPGVVKGLVLRHLRWWLRRPIFTETGLLTVGYGYSNISMSEAYNSPQSPYWSMKAFLPLALAEDDAFWQAEELPLPELPALFAQPRAGMILSRSRVGSNVVALRAGQTPPPQRHAPEKYNKFAYSTGFAFNIPTEPRQLARQGHDSMLALSEDGLHWRVRELTTNPQVIDGVISSDWSPWPDVHITTWLIPHGEWHWRIHRMISHRKLETAEGGFAIHYSDDARRERDNWIAATGRAAISEGRSFSGIRDLASERTGDNIFADPNANLLHPLTIIPTLRGHLTSGEHWLATAVLGLTDARGEEILAQWELGSGWQLSASDFATIFQQAGAERAPAEWAQRMGKSLAL